MTSDTKPETSRSRPENPPPTMGTNATSKPVSKPRRRRDNPFIFVTTWVAGVLAAAASILFGIWAPLAYKAAEDGNNENNAAQASLLSSVSVANSIALAALHTANAQASLLRDAQSQLGAMGQLALVQYCADHTTQDPCSAFLSTLPFTSLASYLASPSLPLATASSSSSTVNPDVIISASQGSGTLAASSASVSITAGGVATVTGAPAPEAGPSSSSSSSGFPIAAVLGIVFGVLGGGGLLLGIFVWRWRRRRWEAEGEEDD